MNNWDIKLLPGESSISQGREELFGRRGKRKKENEEVQGLEEERYAFRVTRII